MSPPRPNGGVVGLMQGREAVPLPVAPWRIRAVVPCFNRRRDVQLLLGDLADLKLDSKAALSVILVDNASDEPLATLDAPPGLAVEHLRLEVNSGGAGGFNTGMRRVLASGVPGDRSELLWILDSDVRIDPGALLALIQALESRPDIVAAGSALIDPVTGKAFECGGRINRVHGEYEQPLPSGWDRASLVPAEYLAACSILVRREAVERAGLMADLFISGDDVEWSLRLAQRTGGSLVAVPASRVHHPNPDKMRTWARYYAARNGFVPMARAGLGRLARFRRAMREVGRAAAQAMLGRDDLAELHLRGLTDAYRGVWGAAPPASLAVEGWTKQELLPAALRRVLAESPLRGRVLVRTGLLADQIAVERALNAACVGAVLEPAKSPRAWRGICEALAALVRGPRYGVAVVSARGRPGDWLLARTIVSVTDDGFVIRRIRPMERARRLAAILSRGTWVALGLAWRGIGASPTVGLPEARALTIGTAVLSCNRWSALEGTLRRLSVDPALAGAPVVVADNASTDGTRERLAEMFPRATVVGLSENRGVAGFNRAVERLETDAVLVLDDDAWPEPGAVSSALDLLARRPDLGAVALHPRHPGTRASEWPFGVRACADWPVMGCGNLVRRHAWERVGGYEEGFFLYRNDTDLAMKLRAAGFGVHYNPDWVVWHDSPVAAGGAKKSSRWFELGTRNWVWVCRRHGRGLSGLAAGFMGWVWAHRLAGADIGRHFRALCGMVRGWAESPPQLPRGLHADGAAVRRLLGLRLARRGASRAPSAGSEAR